MWLKFTDKCLKKRDSYLIRVGKEAKNYRFEDVYFGSIWSTYIICLWYPHILGNRLPPILLFETFYTMKTIAPEGQKPSSCWWNDFHYWKHPTGFFSQFIEKHTESFQIKLNDKFYFFFKFRPSDWEWKKHVLTVNW